MDDFALRDAAVEDATLLSQLDIRSWRETYAGLLSDALLAGLEANPFHEPAYWVRLLSRSRRHRWIWIVGRDDPVGLCHFGAADDGGGVDRLYLLRAAQRRGFGRRLMSMAARVLESHGLRPLTVWTLECNLPAQAFYERLGGLRLPRRPVFEDAGAPVFEVGFRWQRPELLAGITAPRS